MAFTGASIMIREEGMNFDVATIQGRDLQVGDIVVTEKFVTKILHIGRPKDEPEQMFLVVHNYGGGYRINENDDVTILRREDNE